MKRREKKSKSRKGEGEEGRRGVRKIGKRIKRRILGWRKKGIGRKVVEEMKWVVFKWYLLCVRYFIRDKVCRYKYKIFLCCYFL